VLLAVLALDLVGGVPAGAQASGGQPGQQADEEPQEALRGTLTNQKGTRDRTDDEPVPDVDVVATDAAGEEVGRATSDAAGDWEIVLPGPGTYNVAVDEETLPDDVGLAERANAEVSVDPGQSRIQIFQLGARERDVTTTFDRFLQLAFSGVRFGLIIAITSVGLSLIFGTTGLTNFAHGEMVTLGGIAAWYANVRFGLPFIPAVIIAVIVGVIVAALLEMGIWRRLRRRGMSLLAMMVVSIGLSIVLRYGFQFVFGGRSQGYTAYQNQRSYEVGPVNMAPRDLWSMGLILLVLVGVAFLLQRTTIGKAMRAVSDNRDLAASSGIDVDRVIVFVWGLGGGLAAFGGVLFALNERIRFDSGFALLLLMFAGITLGGLGTAYGALVGAFVLGLFVQVSTLWVPSELKNAGALAVLVLVLLVRPQGILGRAERIG
jgi:branched-subunit amino acid ABC-type transport system permease component